MRRYRKILTLFVIQSLLVGSEICFFEGAAVETRKVHPSTHHEDGEQQSGHASAHNSTNTNHGHDSDNHHNNTSEGEDPCCTNLQGITAKKVTFSTQLTSPSPLFFIPVFEVKNISKISNDSVQLYQSDLPPPYRIRDHYALTCLLHAPPFHSIIL